MNNNEGTSWWAMGLDTAKFESDVAKTNALFQSIGKTAESEGTKIDSIFSRIGVAAAGFFTVQQATAFTKNIALVRGEFQQLEVAFNTMLKSKEKADALMSQLVKTAATTPFDLQSVANGARQLLAYGAEVENVNGDLVRLGNIAAGLSQPLNDIVWLYGTTMTQGRLYTQDLNQFTGRGIPMIKELANVLGVSENKVRGLVEEGKVGFPEVQKVIQNLTNEGGMFFNLMEEQSRTITGQISNIEDGFSTMFNEIGKSNEGVINDALSATSYLVQNWEKVAIAIETAIVSYGAYKAATMTMAAYQGATETLKVTTEIEGLKELLQIKEEVSNADLAAAVSSGKLTQAKATELAALREELASRLAVLNAKKAEAAQEAAIALETLNSAKKEHDIAQQKLDDMQTWYDRASELSEEKANELYLDKLQTATVEANTAATRLNTAQKGYNAAASKSKAATQAADTMATAANTVANNANTVSLNIMKAAALQLTGILKGLWATLMANPLAIVLGAVAALGYGIYALATAENEAEKASKKLNEAIDEQTKKNEEYQQKMDALKKSVEDEALSEGERLKAFEQLKAEYPTILNNLLTEAEYLKDIAKYKKLIAEEDNKRAKASDADLLKEAEKTLKHYENFRKQYGKTAVVDMDGNGWATDNVEDAIAAQMKIVNELKARVAEHDVTSFLDRVKEMKSEDIASTIEDINLAIRSLGKSGDDAIAIVSSLGGEFSKTQLKTVKSALEAEQQVRSGAKKTSDEWLADSKAKYDEALKAFNDFEKSKSKLSEVEYERERERLSSELDAAKKLYESRGGKVNGKNENDLTNYIASQNAKILEMEKSQANERKRLVEDLELEIAQSEIDILADGAEKAQKQRDLDNKKEILALKRQKEDYIRSYIQVQKEIFDAKEELKAKQNKNYQKQTFNSSSVIVDSSHYDTLIKNTEARQTKDKLLEEQQAWENYLIQFGNYQEKKKAIIEKYDREIAATTTEGDEKAKIKEKEAALESLDQQYGKTTQAMADLFGDASDKSVNEIQKIIDKYELLVNYMSGSNKDNSEAITIDQLKKVGFTDKDLEKIENGTISIKELTDALKGLKGELNGKSPWQTFFNDMEKGIADVKGANGDIEKIGTGITSIGSSIYEFTPSLEKFGSNISNIFGIDDSKITDAIGALGGLGQTASGVGQIMAGDIVGGAMSAVSGISSVVTAFKGLFGADFSHYNEMKEQYELLNSIWDELISKKQEYIEISYGDEANKVGKEALDIAQKSIESWKILGRERLNSGGSLFSHSIGVDQRKDMSREGWAEAKAALGSDFYKYNIGEGRMTGLFDLSIEQLEKLKSEAPTFWAKLDGDVREYLDNIIEGSERIEDIQTQIKEQLTQVSFDNVLSSFTDLLMDMDSSAEDFADNFEEYMQKAILTTMVGDKYRNKLQAWYDAFAASNNDAAGITKEEMDRSQAEWNAIVAEAVAERDRLKSIFGWTGEESEESTSERSGASKGIQSMSQETADELNGRFTAIQGHTFQINEAVKQMASQMSQMLVLLTGIENNTEYCKHLESINAYIKELKQEFDLMNTKGIKIKQ